MTDYIEKLKKLCDEATPGPWGTRGYSPDKMFGPFFGAGPDTSYEQSYFDAKFIAESRTAIPKLIEAVEVMREALEFYAQPRRDTSFEGWQKTWKPVEIKHDSDYEFYPNHDSALEALKEAEKILKGA